MKNKLITNKRSLIKGAGLSALWATPIVSAIVIPSHAQATGTVDNRAYVLTLRPDFTCGAPGVGVTPNEAFIDVGFTGVLSSPIGLPVSGFTFTMSGVVMDNNGLVLDEFENVQGLDADTSLPAVTDAGGNIAEMYFGPVSSVFTNSVSYTVTVQLSDGNSITETLFVDADSTFPTCEGNT